MLVESTTASKRQFTRNHPYAGLYVVVEGLDGSGKTTTVQSMAERYRRQGYHVVVVREPGGTAIGELLRNELKDASKQMNERTRIAMFYAARAALLDEVVVPELQKGSVVIADRSYMSSYAMQCYAGDISDKEFIALNQAFVGDVIPDSVIYLKVHADIRATRNAARAEETKGTADTYDLRDQAYHEEVAHGYERICRWHGDKTTVVRVNRQWYICNVNGHQVNRISEIQPLIDRYVDQALLPLLKAKSLLREPRKVRLRNKIKEIVSMVRGT